MSHIDWQKSSYCGNGGNNCVQLAATDHHIAIRESTTPHAILTTTPTALHALIRGIKHGEFDGGVAERA
ncbi:MULTISPECIES: DUF397 domain-containing protein [Streptomycetaceae]|uniref:DUF397 domain-containing protein n=1 Tax=Streptantibioticus cattleyicolor (strain ATCC 35852 / DSM 46488 / JCM 4925 / NBRC 14057 / NRRL 8057) TaxID=1003195 RepID=F8JRG6_STREN|nr:MULTISPECIES: DUF397 domain-containing protein [Streptomycetaceae]AEW96671.1 hypothetical protein SCATT_43000 [Streptantibioticus cattleyicolor NRRL 8057 = DSM 46488]MYS61163.1 DUF397 domain-containing protein [Streptomyces sp. SID5468]CCB77010.1 conserved protein of unknown function [Streptantibioticus cattleyicolor NRRL 8057 = DSM 46488]